MKRILCTIALVILAYIGIYNACCYADFEPNFFSYMLLDRDFVCSAEKTNKLYADTISQNIKKQKSNIAQWEEMSQLLESYHNAYAEIANAERKESIVSVKRISGAYVMNSASSYTRTTQHNKTTETGRGADNEEMILIQLSDEHIIRASPRSGPQWLGVRVGEKVRKVEYTWYAPYEEKIRAVKKVEYEPLYR